MIGPYACCDSFKNNARFLIRKSSRRNWFLFWFPLFWWWICCSWSFLILMFIK